MTKRIFRNTMIVVLVVVLLCGVVIFGVMYNYFNKELLSKMFDEAKYISQGVEQGGEEYLKNMANTDCRITWVATDGTVLYDNWADADTMDNHADRQEIKEAMTSSSGNSVRYSDTLSERTVYHAVRLSNGSVIRVANTQSSVLALVFSMMQPVGVVLVLAIVLSALLTYRLSKQIIEPFNQIDLDHPEESEVYEEMEPFVRKIILQNREIQDTMEELRAQRKEFELITENMQEGFIVIDKNAKVLSYNSSALRIFDVDCRLEGQTVLLLNRTEEFRNALKLALEGRHSEIIQTKNAIYYNIFMNPVMNNNAVAGAIIIVTDVTEKEERENLRREFSANVSHELKTPLTSISGIAEIIKNGIVDKEDIPEFADKIYSEARRLIALVEDIINVSQLDERGDTLEKSNVDLHELACDISDYLQEAADKRNIKITVKGDRAVILGVPAVVEEMIYNLCDNAIKYNNEGGQVVITTATSTDLGTNQVGCSISVKDTGIGIAKVDQERVFERFYRVDKSHSKEIGGTGLGLSIVKHGAKLHNADISVESEPGKGTTITLLFKN